jgi:hypothetical protein
VSAPTPLLDFFKRGEVAPDVRLLAAQGGLATRAQEQLAILVLLLEDADEEIRAAADVTLKRIPVEALQKFLARADVSIGLREFFADRGVFPAEIPAIEADEPLVDAPPDASGEELDAAAEDSEASDEERRDSTVAKISKMGFTQRLKAAVKGTREMRSILIRDPNRMIASAVLSSPKLSEPEVEAFSRMANVSDEVLRIIANNRAWMKNYSILLGLVKNPKTPLTMSMNMMHRLNDRDMTQLSVDRNVPEPLRIAARKRIVASTSGKG